MFGSGAMNWNHTSTISPCQSELLNCSFSASYILKWDILWKIEDSWPAACVFSPKHIPSMSLLKIFSFRWCKKCTIYLLYIIEQNEKNLNDMCSFFFSSLKTSQILNDVAHKLAKVAELEGQLCACFYFSTQPVPAILERGIKNKSVVLNNTWSNIFEADSHK